MGRAAFHTFTLSPFRGRGQGEGVCKAVAFALDAHSPCHSPRFLNQCVLRRPLTPTVSPGSGGEGVFFRGAANA